MGQPTPTDAHVDRVLTNISIAYMQEATNFIASRVFPIVPTARQTDKYFTYDQDDWFRLEAKKRAPGTESAGSGYELSTDTFYCDVYAVHKDIDDQLRANADEIINLDRDATEWVTQQMLLQMEQVFVTNYFTTGIWTGSTSGNDQVGVSSGPVADEFLQWNDPASTPIEDIEDLMIEMQEKTGFKPNKLTIGPKVGSALRRHPDILDRIKYTQRGVISDELIASLLDIGEVITAVATRDTALEGVASTYSHFFGKQAMLTYSPASPSLLTPSAGYIFGWDGYTGVGGITGIGTGSRIASMPVPLHRAQRIEGEIAIDMKVVAAQMGIFFDQAVA